MIEGKTILLYDSVQYFIPIIEQRGLRVFRPFKKLTLIGRIARKISIKIKFFEDFWFGEWKNILDEVNTIIVFAADRIDHIEYIKKKYPNIRIILWYWNPVYRSINPKNIPNNLCELWTFDKNDAIEYNLNFNTTFYFKEIPIKVGKSEDQTNEVLFVGANKGRRNSLIKFGELLDKLNKKYIFHIVPDRNERNDKNIKPIPYNEYLNLLSRSSIILDFLQEGQSGLTLRVMESIFFKKKLITNDINVRNELFYKKSNIYILGFNDENDLVDFFNTPFEPLEDSILNTFEFGNWLNRFSINERII